MYIPRISTRFIKPAHLPSFPRRLRLPSRSMSTFKRKADTLTSSKKDPKKPKKDADLASFFGAPKVTTPAGNDAEPVLESPVKFDKDKWVATLTPEQKKLLKLEIDTLDPSWLSQLKEEVTSKEFLDLKRFLQQEIDSGKKIYPPLAEVYSWYPVSVPRWHHR